MAKKEKKENKLAKANKSFWTDFKAFITRGNVLDMAVGVIVGGAFNAIVTALVNILLAVVSWAVPGGIKGLVTVLPAVNDAQKGLPEIGQKFALADLQQATIQFAANSGVDTSNAGGFIVTDASGKITVVDAAGYASMQNALLSKYTLHGTTYTYNMSAVIDWGTFINAVISFLIIAFTLFIIVRVVNKLNAAREAAKAKVQADLEAKKAAKEAEAAE